MTTIKASMTERWNFRDYTSFDCLMDAWCTREEKGQGTAAAHFKTRRPFPMMVMRGLKGQPPLLNLGTGGIPVTGSYRAAVATPRTTPAAGTQATRTPRQTRRAAAYAT